MVTGSPELMINNKKEVLNMHNPIEKGTIVRTVVLGVALVNQALIIAGKNPLPFTNEEVSEGVSMVLTAGAAIWAWWKNNSFTQPAIEADMELKRLKK